ncbi:SMI1/KNR4 family protein [Catellatospora coxensis]
MVGWFLYSAVPWPSCSPTRRPKPTRAGAAGHDRGRAARPHPRPRGRLPAWDGPARVATQAEIAEAEHVIGFPVPPLLRRIYLEVANGGFGPWDSVIGVGESAWTSDALDIVELYQGFSTRPEGHPPGMVPVYDVGCAMWWLVDFSDPAGPMWGGTRPAAASCMRCHRRG